jgi:hypothetical protein
MNGRMNDRDLAAYIANIQGAPTAAPWNLAALSDKERADVLEHLGQWVRWLTERFALADLVPACWPRHGAHVEELLALHMAWRAAYEEPAAPANAPLAWMDAFHRARQRLREWNRWGCAAGTHRPEPPFDSNGVETLARHYDSNHAHPQHPGAET